ncbi:tetratricopeptide repeat protein [Sphingomonas sp. LT1P40]|uniref:tetratricopeptide repeat protein n=1 Tax=Alteristakelama amylovorans TaxID=3096166 RepID=UPI002FC990EA
MPARAEAVRMTGKFAAPYREAALLESLRIGRFSGQDGPQLEMAIERALSRPDIEGKPHFDIVGGRGGDADGVLSGNVTSGVQESRFKRKEKKCVEREGGKDSGKCLKEEEVEIDCTRRVVNVTADLRLARRDDGRVVYSTGKPRRDETSWCRGQNPPRTAEEAIRGMVLAIADDVRRDIAPTVETYNIRFRESPKGLPKPLNRPFKDIVKQTQRDLRAACAAWGVMDAQAPNHPSITFDLGLCAEAAGDFPRAREYYRRAAPLIGRGNNEATTGLERVDRLIAAQEDDAARTPRR